jgi:hypothetical protein
LKRAGLRHAGGALTSFVMSWILNGNAFRAQVQLLGGWLSVFPGSLSSVYIIHPCRSGGLRILRLMSGFHNGYEHWVGSFETAIYSVNIRRHSA